MTTRGSSLTEFPDSRGNETWTYFLAALLGLAFLAGSIWLTPRSEAVVKASPRIAITDTDGASR